MPDFASSCRNRVGGQFFDGAGHLIALDPRPRMTLLLRESFDTGPGVFVPKASTGVNTGSNPVTNGSVHIYRTNQVSVSGGNLVFTPTKEGSQWYSGYCDTDPGFSVTAPFGIYSKFRLPYGFGPGAWPSVWGLFGVPHTNWPTNEEGDQFEWVNAHTDRIYFTSHYDVPYGSGSSGHQAKPDYNAGVKNYVTGFDPTAWHEVLMIVRAGIGFEWYLDGQLIFVTNGYNNSPTPRFINPYRMIANFAIGGSNGFPDNPDGTSNTGSGDTNKFLIDTIEVYRVRPPQTFFGGVQYPSVTTRPDGTDVKLIKDDGSYLFPPTTGGGSGGGTGGGTGTGLPPAGVHALFNPTTSPTRVPIDWTAATIDGTARITSSLMSNTGAPYAAIADSGVVILYPSSTEVGRLTINVNGYNTGTYTYPCPVGIQPSVSGIDGPVQMALANGQWIDVYGITGSHITWSGNNGTCNAQGITVKNWQTGTGWPSGTITSIDKFGFAACGASIAAGTITTEDKQLGYIAHALAFIFGNNGLATGPWRPALREDSPQGSSYPSGNTFFHQGSLLGLPPTSRGGVAVPTGFTAFEKAICGALTNYGGYVMDRTGGFAMRVTNSPVPGVSASLSSADFAGFQSLATGSLGKFLIDNLRLITGAKPSLGAAHA